MRIAFVFDRKGKQPLMKDGAPIAFPVAKWWTFVKDENGRWELHLLAHMFATTEDFRFQQYQGVFAIGRGFKGLWAHLSIGRKIWRIGDA